MEPNYDLIGKLLAPDISQMLEEGEVEEVREALLRLMDPELADVLMTLSPEHRVQAMGHLLPAERAAQVFPLLPETQQRQLLQQLRRWQLAGILNEMHPDDRTDLLEGLPDSLVLKLLAILTPEERREAKNLLSYPPESVGRLMTTDYLTVQPDWTVQQVLEHIRRYGGEAETLNTQYLVDDQGKLLDDVSLRTLLLAEPQQPVTELVDGQVVSLQATADREEAVRAMERYDLPVIPVVDEQAMLVGIVTFDDVADVAQEEATEDFHKTAAVAPLPMAYFQTSIWALYHRRVGWLVILVFVNLVSSGVIAAYENTLEATIALAFFLPLLIDSGGNTGSQAATLMVRALATQDVVLRQWLRTLLRELGVGAILAVTMAVASMTLGVFRADWRVGLVVGLSMFAIIVAANLIGTLLPFLLTRLRIDPAVASSPLITTVADAVGLLLYFNIATWVLG